MIYQNRKVCVTWNEFGKQKKAILYHMTFNKDFEMNFSDKLKISLKFKENIVMSVKLIGILSADAGDFLLDKLLLKEFFYIESE